MPVKNWNWIVWVVSVGFASHLTVTGLLPWRLVIEKLSSWKKNKLSYKWSFLFSFPYGLSPSEENLKETQSRNTVFLAPAVHGNFCYDRVLLIVTWVIHSDRNKSDNRSSVWDESRVHLGYLEILMVWEAIIANSGGSSEATEVCGGRGKHFRPRQLHQLITTQDAPACLEACSAVQDACRMRALGKCRHLAAFSSCTCLVLTQVKLWPENIWLQTPLFLLQKHLQRFKIEQKVVCLKRAVFPQFLGNHSPLHHRQPQPIIFSFIWSDIPEG